MTNEQLSPDDEMGVVKKSDESVTRMEREKRNSIEGHHHPTSVDCWQSAREKRKEIQRKGDQK